MLWRRTVPCTACRVLCVVCRCEEARGRPYRCRARRDSVHSQWHRKRQHCGKRLRDCQRLSETVKAVPLWVSRSFVCVQACMRTRFLRTCRNKFAVTHALAYLTHTPHGVAGVVVLCTPRAVWACSRPVVRGAYRMQIHLAIKAAQKPRKRFGTASPPPHIVTTNIEHPAIDRCLAVSTCRLVSQSYALESTLFTLKYFLMY